MSDILTMANTHVPAGLAYASGMAHVEGVVHGCVDAAMRAGATSEQVDIVNQVIGIIHALRLDTMGRFKMSADETRAVETICLNARDNMEKVVSDEIKRHL